MGLKSLEFVRGTFVMVLSESAPARSRVVWPPRYRFHMREGLASRLVRDRLRRRATWTPHSRVGSGSFSSTPPSAGTVNISAKRE